jgi:hypothetical protein
MMERTEDGYEDEVRDTHYCSLKKTVFYNTILWFSQLILSWFCCLYQVSLSKIKTYRRYLFSKISLKYL